MNIRKREKKEQKSSKEFQIHLSNEEYSEINLKYIWEETLLDEVYFKKSVCHEISNWAVKKEVDLNIPEEAGFLLGGYSKKNDVYQLYVDSFSPSNRLESNNNSRIDFGINAMIDLNQELESNPQDILVGWLHTHPGHTPYLSKVDLYTQEGFFKEPFQIAVVIDNLTSSLYTSIFSWKTDNKMNNSFNDPDKWIPWVEILSK